MSISITIHDLHEYNTVQVLTVQCGYLVKDGQETSKLTTLIPSTNSSLSGVSVSVLMNMPIFFCLFIGTKYVFGAFGRTKCCFSI